LRLVAAGVLATPAAAANCAKDYKDFWDNNSPLAKSLTAEQYAKLSRTALRGYDACSAGDERFASDFFNKLGSALAKPEDVFNQINSSPLAKQK
jgi:hypothetical protein